MKFFGEIGEIIVRNEAINTCYVRHHSSWVLGWYEQLWWWYQWNSDDDNGDGADGEDNGDDADDDDNGNDPDDDDNVTFEQTAWTRVRRHGKQHPA